MNMVIPRMLVRKEEMLWCLGWPSLVLSSLKQLTIVLLSIKDSCSVSALEYAEKTQLKRFLRIQKSGVGELVRHHAVVSV